MDPDPGDSKAYGSNRSGSSDPDPQHFFLSLKNDVKVPSEVISRKKWFFVGLLKIKNEISGSGPDLIH
jgi:hypothetical protein